MHVSFAQASVFKAVEGLVRVHGRPCALLEVAAHLLRGERACAVKVHRVEGGMPAIALRGRVPLLHAMGGCGALHEREHLAEGGLVQLHILGYLIGARHRHRRLSQASPRLRRPLPKDLRDALDVISRWEHKSTAGSIRRRATAGRMQLLVVNVVLQGERIDCRCCGELLLCRRRRVVADLSPLEALEKVLCEIGALAAMFLEEGCLLKLGTHGSFSARLARVHSGAHEMRLGWAASK